MKDSFHGIDKTNKAGKMAPCAKAFAAKPSNWSSISGPTWWKEAPAHTSCLLTLTCMPRHAHMLLTPHQKGMEYNFSFKIIRTKKRFQTLYSSQVCDLSLLASLHLHHIAIMQSNDRSVNVLIHWLDNNSHNPIYLLKIRPTSWGPTFSMKEC